MPLGWRPSVLRTSRLRWLLELTWSGQVYRLAEEPIEAPTALDGSDDQYSGGLDLGGEYAEAIELFADSPAPRAVSLTLHLGSLVDVPARIAAGHDLQSATGRLMLWPDGGAARDVLVVLDGVLREPEHGAATEPITCTLAEDEEEADGLIPDDGARYTSTTWAGGTGDTDRYGERYPIVFGRPGAGTYDGSPSIMVSNARLLIAGHEVAAGTIDVYDETNGTTDNNLAVVEMADGSGRRVSTVTGFVNIGIAGVLQDGDPYWIRWDDGGGLEVNANEIRGAGEVLAWLLQRSGGRYDRGRTAAAAERLDLYLIDGYLMASPEERVRPLDWIREHLAPVLPMSIRLGPDGYYPVVWRWDAVQADAVAEIDADRSGAARVDAISYSARDEIRNELILRYRPDARTDRYQERIGITGDPVAADEDSNLRLHLWARHSYTRYGRRVLEATTDVIAETATAQRVLSWWARRYCLPTRLVIYVVPARMAWVEPGSVVLVSDDEVGLSDAVGLVERAVWRAGDVVLGVRLLDRPEGDLDR